MATNNVILLRVPMIPPNTLLQLLKMRSFSIPITDHHYLMPAKTPELLDILSTELPQWTISSQYSLINCHKVNSIYVCPENRVLGHNLKSHCVGALYMEDNKVAKVLYDLDIIPEQGQVLGFSDIDYLIYSTKAEEVSLKCPHIPNEVKRIPDGVTSQQIPISCAMKSKNTTIYSAFSLRLKSELKHYQWKDTTVKEFVIDEEHIAEETKQTLPHSRHDKIHISKTVEQKQRWHNKKLLRQLPSPLPPLPSRPASLPSSPKSSSTSGT